MNELFEKGLVLIKPKVLFENFCIAATIFLGKTLLDIYYGRDIWLSDNNTAPIEEGNPDFYSETNIKED